MPPPPPNAAAGNAAKPSGAAAPAAVSSGAGSSSGSPPGSPASAGGASRGSAPATGSAAGVSVAGSSIVGATVAGSAATGVVHTSATAVRSSRSSGREQFGTEELAIVLSHYDIGILDSIVEYPRGSRKAPKLLIVSDQGKYLLKRRARGKDDPYKVAFSHSLQLYLASKQFPLPHLIGTKRDNNSMLQWRNGVYELFEYIPGQVYPQTLEATYDSGRVLSLYHKLLSDFQSEWQPSSGSYHAAPSVEQGLRNIAAGVGDRGEETAAMLRYLYDSYRYAAQQVEDLGLSTWPKQIVHADWHPGNMLFRDNHVVGVIDYDSSRLLPRIIDVANGGLQFSILGGDEDVAKWPAYCDESRFKRFFRGYDQVTLLSEAELKAVPWLMAEALIAEAVFPIAATGQFGKMEGLAFLTMVQRKVEWMQKSANRLIQLASGG